MMYWSKLFIPPLREDPARAASDAHRLLIRAGYIRRPSQGSYNDNYLFAAERSFLKITSIVRQEMDAIGAQETLLAEVLPLTSGTALEGEDRCGGQ